MQAENIVKNFFGEKSSRHHYLPRFLIEGFTNPKGQVFIYDKIKDEILNYPRSSKSIFFEKDRNTTYFPNSIQSSFIEDIIYKHIDNKTSKTVRKYQSEKLNEIDLNINDEMNFYTFLQYLYLRIPATDLFTEFLLNDKNLNIEGLFITQLKKNPYLKKIQRIGLVELLHREMLNFGTCDYKFSRIHQLENDILVLGDNPILFRKQLDKFSQFNDHDFFIAISRSRIYSSTNLHRESFVFKNAINYNVAIINQSLRYVVSGNRDALSKSVEYFRLLKKNKWLEGINEHTFADF